MCNCGEMEDPFHFLLECKQYNLIRRDMLTPVYAVCNPNLNILLNGKRKKSQYIEGCLQFITKILAF